MDRMCVRFVALAVSVLGAPVFADITVRYTTDVKFGPALPPNILDRIRSGSSSALSGPTVIQLKGDKAYSSSGTISSVEDYATNQMTYIDSANMRFATVSREEFTAKMAGAMPHLGAAASNMFKTEVQTRKTGRSETIQGVRAEEYLVEITMSLAKPLTIAPAGPISRTVVHIWRATAEDTANNPVLAEYAGLEKRNDSFTKSADFVRELTSQFQGLGAGIEAVRGEMTKEQSPVVRIQTDVFMPMLQSDPAAPAMSMDQEIVYSNEPVADGVFQTPKGFRSVAIEEILKDQFAAIGASVR